MVDICLFDSTIRDGGQTPDTYQTSDEALQIVKALDDIGIQGIEGFYANLEDSRSMAFYKGVRRLKPTAIIYAFAGITCSDDLSSDPNIQGLSAANTSGISMFVKGCKSPLMTDAPSLDAESYSKRLSESIQFFKNLGKIVNIDVEHAIDGFKETPKFFSKIVQASALASADFITLCDTRGKASPEEIDAAFTFVRKLIGNVPSKLGVHAHEDRSMGVANSMRAVRSSAVMVQGTFLGTGERCGNASLITLIGNLNEEGVPTIELSAMSKLRETALKISEILRIPLAHNFPYVGQNAFAHVAGVHGNTVRRDPSSYEHCDPDRYGNARQIMVTSQAGRGSIEGFLALRGIVLDKKDPLVGAFLRQVKQAEEDSFRLGIAQGSVLFWLIHHIYPELPTTEILSLSVRQKRGRWYAWIEIKQGNQCREGYGQGDTRVTAIQSGLSLVLKDLFPELIRQESKIFHEQLDDGRFRVNVNLPNRESTQAVDSDFNMAIAQAYLEGCLLPVVLKKAQGISDKLNSIQNLSLC